MVTKAEKERRDSIEISGDDISYYEKLTLEDIVRLFDTFNKNTEAKGFTLSGEPWVDIYQYYDDTTITIKGNRFETDEEYADRLANLEYLEKKKRDAAKKKKDAEYQTYLKLKKIYEE